jgi:hypothetical protein
MGAEPWQYFVPHQSDLQAALEQLKQEEFRAGRFRYSEEGPQTIDEAREIADADGTASILDIDRVANQPDFGVVVPLSAAKLQDLFGTDRPTRDQVEWSDDLFEEIDRGQGVVCTVYDNGRPSELCFAGYSYD